VSTKPAGLHRHHRILRPEARCEDCEYAYFHPTDLVQVQKWARHHVRMTNHRVEVRSIREVYYAPEPI